MPLVIGGLLLSYLIMLLFGGTEVDRALLVLLTSGNAPRLREAAAAANWLAGPVPLLAMGAAGAAYLLARRRWRDALYLAALILLGRLLVDLQQWLTLDLRPSATERLLPTQALGYPSGHAANATITAFALAFLAARHIPARTLALAAAALFALAVGTARILAGASWPSDVIGGWAFGLAWVLLLLLLARADLGDGTARPVHHFLPQGEKDDRESEDRDRPPQR